MKIAYLVTHPIQYQAPLLRLLTERGQMQLKAFFLSDFSLRAHREAAFGREVNWDVPLTEGYDWEVLPRWLTGPSGELRPRWPVAGLEQRLLAGKFDAVWVHGWGHVGLRQGIRAARRLRLPLLLRGETTPDGSRATGFKRWVRDAYCRRLIGQAAGCLCIGSRNREFYRQFGASDQQLFSVPYAVDNAWFQARCHEAAAKRESLRTQLGLQPGRPVILFAAKFIPVKAPGDLLQAYQTAWGRDGQDDARKPYLLYVGDGPLRGQLEQQAGALKDRYVRFLGFKNQSELPALYDLCDVFVLPSHFEPWGLVVNEVMNAAKPVVVSDRVGCAPDLLTDGANGFVYSAGDAGALATSLKQICECPPADRSCMGQKSLERINTWNFEADQAGLLQALQAVVKKRPSHE
jgi:glycosyltransferase involved in cell wall biosynthesis